MTRFQTFRANAAKIATGAGVLVLSAQSHAAGLDDVFDAVDLSTVATKVGALAVAIVGIALVVKGPSIVKRIIARI